MLSEAIRRYGFWLYDALSGGQIRRYVSDLEKKLQGKPDASSEDLRKLLDHAVRTTEFYKEFKGYSDIKDFPVIKKSLVKEKYHQFVSSEYKNKRLHKMSTSGSSGERFVMLQDRQKRKRVLSEIIYFHEQCGFHFGYRYVYVRVWHGGNKKTKLVQMAENLIMFDCSALSDESLARLYELLMRDRTIKCLTGYANSLGAIASYFNKKGYTSDMFKIKIVSSGAERLEPADKALLKKVFGCPVVSRYSNNENGVLAQQPVDGDNFIMNNAHYFFEALNLDNDQPASYGDPARLVLTDLYNYAMPLIRYDTEDIVIMGKLGERVSEKDILTEISGRRSDIIYDTQGNKISPHYVAIIFRKYDKLPEYQLIQENLMHFTLKLEGVRGLYTDDDLKDTIRNLVGSDAFVAIEHVDKIPHLSPGKFRRIICNYKVDDNG
jgi:phenylacetate-CoA ligase